MIVVQAMTVQYAWRAWGLYQPFPLFFNTFFWWYPADPKWIVLFFVGAGAFDSLVAIPVLALNHGKRFCTWICGCGGLAETLGDRWRHLSPKGERSRAWEFQAFVVLLASVLVGVVVVGLFHTAGNNPWWRAYNYLVDFWLVAVIPIALYPFFGGKVWCRLVPAGGLQQAPVEMVLAPQDRLQRQVHHLHRVFEVLSGGGRRDGLRQEPAAVRQLELGLHPLRHLHRRLPDGRVELRDLERPGGGPDRRGADLGVASVGAVGVSRGPDRRGGAGANRWVGSTAVAGHRAGVASRGGRRPLPP